DDEVDQLRWGVPRATLPAIGAGPLGHASRLPTRLRGFCPVDRRVVVSSDVPDAAPSERNGRYLTFNRDEWAEMRAATPMTLREPDLERLRGINVSIDLDEVAAIYLPLSRLLN